MKYAEGNFSQTAFATCGGAAQAFSKRRHREAHETFRTVTPCYCETKSASRARVASLRAQSKKGRDQSRIECQHKWVTSQYTESLQRDGHQC